MEKITKRYIPEFEEKMLGEPFFSRKNRVFGFRSGNQTLVVKVFSEKFIDRASAEYKILEKCFKNNVKVPTPIECRNGAIIMSYINGDNAGDIFDKCLTAYCNTHKKSRTATKNQASPANMDMKNLMDNIANWLFRFHKAFEFKVVRGESILRNFILSGQEIYGLDFEETREGDPLSDVGCMYAHILGISPQFKKVNFEASELFARNYWRYSGKDRSGELPSAVAESLEFYAKFRKDGQQLMEWAKKIMKNGLAPDKI